MTDATLPNILNSLLRSCVGWADDAIKRARKDALDYYLQRPRGDEIQGRSAVVSGDVSASVDANHAAMLESLSSDAVMEFDPFDADDEDQAKLESDTVAYYVMKSQNGYMELSKAVKNALLQRIAIGKVWVDVQTVARIRTYDAVEREVVPEVVGEGAELVSYDDATQVLRTRETEERKHLRSEAVAPENFFYPSTWEHFDLQMVPFCAERHVDTRSALVQMGVERAIVDKLQAYAASSVDRSDSAARDPSGLQLPEAKQLDKSLELIEWFECYVLLDRDNDGVAERYCIFYSHRDGKVLKEQAAPLVPYAVGTAIVMPHRVAGLSIYDKLRQVQDERTGLKRALYDNVNAVTKNRVAYLAGRVSQEDLNDGRANGQVRVSGVEDVRQAIMPFAVPDNSANILQNLEALKRERAEMGGAALDMATGQMLVGGDRMGSEGLDRAYSVAEQLSALMTRTLAHTFVRSLFLVAHATMREHFTTPLKIKRRGKWVSMVPAEWPARQGVTVKLGMSPGERARQVAALDKILRNQFELAQFGMDEVLVNLDGFHKVLLDRDRISDVQNPEQYYVDPSSESAQKALQAKTMASRAEQRKREALMAKAVGLEELRVALDKYRADQSTQFNYWKGVLDSEVEEAKIVGKVAGDLVAARQTPPDAPAPAPESPKEEAAE